MFIYARALCIHILLIFIICRIYGTFQQNARTDVEENNARSMTRRFIFDSNGRFSGWTSWEHYAACSTTCVKEYENQTRACCDTGNNFLCYTIPWKNLAQYVGSCPVNGRWSLWSSFTTCDVTCGNGTKVRKRTCEYPDGLLQGSSCVGNNTESLTCNDVTCPGDGQWGPWTSWSSCTVTCGHSIHQRTRVCEFLPDRPRGHDCASGEVNQTKSCTLRDCPVDGVWLQWTSWSPCTVTCGGGTRDRRRDCYYQPPAPPGDPCLGAMFETNVCNNQTCPVVLYDSVDGNFDHWSTWSTCTVTCGGGIQSRQRGCLFHPPNAPIGRNCSGLWNESKICSTLSCEQMTTMPAVTEPIPTRSIDGVFGEWSTWGTCSATCGDGIQSRQRTCFFHPPDAPIGRNCTGSWNESQICSTFACSPRSCFQCLGPTNLCEKLNAPLECPMEKQYCINTLDNKEDASRDVVMRCGTRQECESGWFSKYAFNDRCTRFDQDFVYTNKIYCEFCCAEDDCNAKINPDDKWQP